MKHLHGLTEIKFTYPKNVSAVSVWLRSNCEGAYSFPLEHNEPATIYCPIIYFHKETDATMFLLSEVWNADA